MPHPTEVRTLDYPQRLAAGLQLPTRMTVLPLRKGVALVSPVPLDDARAASTARVDEVRYLIAPNLLHHLYLDQAQREFPDARLLAPRALSEKRPDLRVDGFLEDGLPDDVRESVDMLAIQGAPALSEFVFFHRETRTLVVADLVFNVQRPRGWLSHCVLGLVGCHGRLAQSRALRLMFRDRAAAARSAARLLDLDIDTLIMAHGDIVESDAHAQLREALRWMGRGIPRELPAHSPQDP